MMIESKNVENFILSNILIVSIVGVSIMLLSYIFMLPEDTLTIVSASAILFACVLAFFIRLKNPKVAVIILTSITLLAMTYQRLMNPSLTTTLGIVLIVGFVFSIMLKGMIMWIMHSIAFIIINTIFVFHYNGMEVFTAATTYSTMYFVLSFSAGVLKSSYDKINQNLSETNSSLNEKAKHIEHINEELKNQHQNILVINKELVALNTEKNNLIGIVAHDLKSPLNQIKGLISVIKLTPSSINGEAVEYIQMIENSATRLTNMIGKILDVQAIDSKQLNLTFERVDFSEVVRSIADRFALEAQNKHITLHSLIVDNVKVNVDRSYTEEVIENLLSNAIKFSPTDKNIYINITTKDNSALCEIRDEGPGLSKDDKSKLFGKYQRLSATPTGNESSTGLGLSIVKRFVDAMKGEIWCESEVGKGASFFVRFDLSSS